MRVGLCKCVVLWEICIFCIYESLKKIADSSDTHLPDQSTHMQTDTMAPTTWSSKTLYSIKDDFYYVVFVKLKNFDYNMYKK